MKLALPGYILPFMFIYHPILISWNFMDDFNIGRLIFAIVLALCMSLGFAGATQGYFFRKTTYAERVLLFIGAFCVIPSQVLTNIIGVFIIGLVPDIGKAKRNYCAIVMKNYKNIDKIFTCGIL